MQVIAPGIHLGASSGVISLEAARKTVARSLAPGPSPDCLETAASEAKLDMTVSSLHQGNGHDISIQVLFQVLFVQKQGACQSHRCRWI
jgi:hypothetical protein